MPHRAGLAHAVSALSLIFAFSRNPSRTSSLSRCPANDRSGNAPCSATPGFTRVDRIGWIGMTSVIRRVGFSISLAALGLLWGCSHGGNSSGGGASLAPTSSATTTGTTPTTSTTTTAPFSTVSPVARLYADVNRDGVIDGNDDAGRDTWTSSRGAIFVYNNDDDDGKHAIDCSDSIINGPMDPRTDTVIVAGQYTGGTPQSVTLSIAPATAPVRIFLRDA